MTGTVYGKLAGESAAAAWGARFGRERSAQATVGDIAPDRPGVLSWRSLRCRPPPLPEERPVMSVRLALSIDDRVTFASGHAFGDTGAYEIGRASCRERVCQYV